MKVAALLPFLGIALLVVAPASGATVVDQFFGDPGTPLTNWDGDESAFTYQEGSLTHPQLSSAGNSARLDASIGSGNNTRWTAGYTGAIPGGVSAGENDVYMTFLISADSVDDFSDASRAGVQITAYRTIWVGIGRDGDGLFIGGAEGSDTPNYSEAYTPGETVLVAMHITNLDFGGWDTPDYAFAFNPDLSEEPTWQYFSVGGNASGGVDPSGLALFTRMATVAGGWNDDKYAAANVDEFRMGTTWEAVVPEPATLALLGIGGLGMLIRRRR
ncbi:MAG: PEP-CTERM sorting domain-containing protein [Phycisphaerae bacterium]